MAEPEPDLSALFGLPRDVAEWDACDDFCRFAYFLAAPPPECYPVLSRRFRLLIAAVLRVDWDRAEQQVRAAVQAAERSPTGPNDCDLLAARDALRQITVADIGDDPARIRRLRAAWAACTRQYPFPAGAMSREDWPAVLDGLARHCDTGPHHLPLFRCLFPNPYRPVVFAPEWRTDAVVGIARAVHDRRDYGALPVLADALQDAGCDDADVLGHCRGGGPHARGCWVVDMVRGSGSS